MAKASLIAISVDMAATSDPKSKDCAGVTHVQDSPAGASRLGFFKWPTLPPELEKDLEAWFKEQLTLPPKQLGERLFSHVFAGDPKQKLLEALKRVHTQDRILIGISTADPQMHALPFETLHTGQAFLAAGSQIVFRHVNDGIEIAPKTHGFRRFLIILAEPKDPGLAQFNHDDFLAKLKTSFSEHSPAPAILAHASKKTVLDCLNGATESFDAIIIVAHGKAATDISDGFVLLEDQAGNSDQLSAGVLADALKAHQGCLVVLCSCSSGMVIDRNPLAGVAQRLMSSGYAGAVIAMQRPIGIKAGRMFVETICKKLRDGAADIFDAFGTTVTEVCYDKGEHGIPCLYARLSQRLADGVGLLTGLARTPDDELLRLQSVLNGDQDSKFAFSLAQFRMGEPLSGPHQPSTDTEKSAQEPRSYHYPGPTNSIHDVFAIEHFVALVGRYLARGALRGRLDIVADWEAGGLIDRKTYTHFVLIGSRSHALSREKLKYYSQDFEFNFDSPLWTLIDKRTGKVYEVDPPDQSGSPNPDKVDYAIIEKIIDTRSGLVLFVIAGMWDSSTEAAGRYLVENLDDIFRTFGTGGFQYILETRQGKPEVENVLCKRRPRISGT